jgi:hypothetical protein
MEDVRIFYSYLVYFMVIWYISPVLGCWSKKNLATLVVILEARRSGIATA